MAVARIPARDLEVGDRLVIRQRRRRPWVATVTSVRRFEADAPAPAAVFVTVRGAWADEQYQPDTLVEVDR